MKDYSVTALTLEGMAQTLWKTVWQFLKKLNTHLHDPVILSLGIYSREHKTVSMQNFVHE